MEGMLLPISRGHHELEVLKGNAIGEDADCLRVARGNLNRARDARNLLVVLVVSPVGVHPPRGHVAEPLLELHVRPDDGGVELKAVVAAARVQPFTDGAQIHGSLR
eukprot:135043-Prymnesium_polylepis.2